MDKIKVPNGNISEKTVSEGNSSAWISIVAGIGFLIGVILLVIFAPKAHDKSEALKQKIAEEQSYTEEEKRECDKYQGIAGLGCMIAFIGVFTLLGSIADCSVVSDEEEKRRKEQKAWEEDIEHRSQERIEKYRKEIKSENKHIQELKTWIDEEKSSDFYKEAVKNKKEEQESSTTKADIDAMQDRQIKELTVKMNKLLKGNNKMVWECPFCHQIHITNGEFTGNVPKCPNCNGVLEKKIS